MPAPKPKSIKLLRGTFRKDREAADPPKPREGRARPPKWLPGPEKRAFRQLAAEVEASGVPSRTFAHVLTAAAVTWVQVARCTVVLEREGEVYESMTTRGAPKLTTRPEAQLRTTALRLLRAYLDALGLTPMSIGRVDRTTMLTLPAGRNEKRVERFFGRRAPK